MLEQVVGGKKNVVHNPHRGYNYVNCRKKPGVHQPVYFTIPNGEEVFPTGKKVRKDGFDWYEIKPRPQASESLHLLISKMRKVNNSECERKCSLLLFSIRTIIMVNSVN